MHKKLSSKDGLKIMFGWILLEGTVIPPPGEDE
jgi:hypothetical protein